MKATRDHHRFSLSDLPGYAEQCAKLEAMLRSARPGTPEYELAAVFNWELDASGQPTQRLVESRRRAEFITPIPKPKKNSKKNARNPCRNRPEKSGQRNRSMVWF